MAPKPPSPVSTALAVDEALLKSSRPRRKIKRNCTCSIGPLAQLLTDPQETAMTKRTLKKIQGDVWVVWKLHVKLLFRHSL
jgi:hypothetical protein